MQGVLGGAEEWAEQAWRGRGRLDLSACLTSPRAGLLRAHRRPLSRWQLHYSPQLLMYTSSAVGTLTLLHNRLD